LSASNSWLAHACFTAYGGVVCVEQTRLTSHACLRPAILFCVYLFINACDYLQFDSTAGPTLWTTLRTSMYIQSTHFALLNVYWRRLSWLHLPCLQKLCWGSHACLDCTCHVCKFLCCYRRIGFDRIVTCSLD
jgi:hypothetical protein